MDRAGRTQLHYAALENNIDLVTALISGGADVNARDKLGFTPLHFACQQGAVESARALLDAGAEVDQRDDFGRTPLLTAVLNPPPLGELILLLRERGANPIAASFAGMTPTSSAREMGNYDLTQYFEDVLDPPGASDVAEPLPSGATARASGEAANGPQDLGWWQEYQRLWDELVPPRGQASTIQGELIRCIGRLTDEAYHNGNQNWRAGSGHDRMLAFIERTLLGDATFAAAREAAIRTDLARMGDFEHPDTRGAGTSYYKLAEAAVDWCGQHPKPIPREADADLNM